MKLSTPKSLEDFSRILATAPTKWVAETIHPHVPRESTDTNAAYFRKMALHMQATNSYPENSNTPKMTGPEK